MLVLLSFQGAQQIEMASGTETQVSKDSQLYKDYAHLFLNSFSKDSLIVMVEGNEVKSAALLKAADRFALQTEGLFGINTFLSPASVLKQINYELSGRAKLPESDQEVQKLLETYPSSFETLLPDESHMLISIGIKGSATDKQKEDLLKAVQISAKEAAFPPGYVFTITGGPALMLDINKQMGQSMGLLLGIAAFLMIGVLFLVFRNVRWGLLPLPVVLLGIIFTFGFMGYTGVPMTMVSMAAFPVLIGIGIDYAIQFHNRMEEEIKFGKSPEKALVHTVKHTGPAVLIALTMTALGFVSLFTSTVPMIRDFGKLLLIGIVMCYLSSLFFGLVTLYSFDWLTRKNPFGLFKKKKKSEESDQKEQNINKNKKRGKALKPEPLSLGAFKPAFQNPGALEKILQNLTGFTLKHTWALLIIASLTAASGVYMDQSIPIKTDTNSFIPQDMPSLVDFHHMQSVMSGQGNHLNLILKVKDTSDPTVLQWMDEFEKHEVASRGHIYSATSIVKLVKERNGGVLPESSQAIKAIYAKIPANQKEEYMKGNQLLHIDLDIGSAMNELQITGISELKEIVAEDIRWMQPPPGVTVTITGESAVLIEMIAGLTSGRVKMTMLGVFLVLLGLFVVYRNPVKAFSPIIPMLIVIGWSGLVMKGMNLDYNPMTAVMGALILGVGSEYSILMMERYYEEKEKGLSPQAAITQAVTTTGTALVASGATTVFGFSALIASPFPIISDFGLVTVIDVLLAMLVTFVIFPPLVVFMDSKLGNFKKYNMYFGESQK